MKLNFSEDRFRRPLRVAESQQGFRIRSAMMYLAPSSENMCARKAPGKANERLTGLLHQNEILLTSECRA